MGKEDTQQLEILPDMAICKRHGYVFYDSWQTSYALWANLAWEVLVACPVFIARVDSKMVDGMLIRNKVIGAELAKAPICCQLTPPQLDATYRAVNNELSLWFPDLCTLCDGYEAGVMIGSSRLCPCCEGAITNSTHLCLTCIAHAPPEAYL